MLVSFMTLESSDWIVCPQFSERWFITCGPVALIKIVPVLTTIVLIAAIPYVITHAIILARKKLSIGNIIYKLTADVILICCLLFLFATLQIIIVRFGVIN